MSFMDVRRMSATMHQVPYLVTIASAAAVSSQVIIENTFMLSVAVLNVGPAWTAANIGLEVRWTVAPAAPGRQSMTRPGTRVMVTNVTTTAGSVRKLYYLPVAAHACMRYASCGW